MAVKLAPSILAADFARAERRKPGCDVEVDGGIDATTAPLVVRADATVWVARSSSFGDRDGVATAMNRRRTASDRTNDETELAGRAALQRSR